jgi:hypothetical protein
MIEGSHRMHTRLTAAGRASQGLAVHRDEPPLSRPRHRSLLRPGARQVIGGTSVQAQQRPPKRRHHAPGSQHRRVCSSASAAPSAIAVNERAAAATAHHDWRKITASR